MELHAKNDNPKLGNYCGAARLSKGTLVAFNKDGYLIYEKAFDLDIHSQTQFIQDGNKLYFQTTDGDIVHFIIDL